MPHAIQNAPPTLEQFAKLAEHTSEKGSIVFKHGTLVSTGRAGTLFSRHSSRRAAMNALQKSITDTYGADVTNLVSGQLTEICRKGKPLRASVVRQILHAAHAAHDVRFFQNFKAPAAQQAVHSFAEKHGFNEAQQQELYTVVETEMGLRPKLFPNEGKPLNQEAICQQLEKGLPCMNIMAQMLSPGKSPALPFLYYAPGPDERADIAWLQAFVPPKVADCAAAPDMDLCCLLQHMQEMRALQPHGPLTVDTVWQACFGEKPPENLHLQSPDLAKAWSQRLKAQVTDALKQHNALDPVNVASVFNALVNGLKLDAAAARVMHPAPITLQDLCRQPTALHYNPRNDNAQSVEANVAADIYRMALPWPGFNPTFSFTTRDGDVTTIHPMRDEGLSPADKEAWKYGEPSQRSREVMEAAASLCAPDAHAQKLVVAMGFHQSALQMPKFFNSFAAVNLSEHTACDISARADAAGNVHLHYKTPENAASQLEMTILVRPDGSNTMTHFAIRAAPQAVPPAPGRAAAPVPGRAAPQELMPDARGVDASESDRFGVDPLILDAPGSDGLSEFYSDYESSSPMSGVDESTMFSSNYYSESSDAMHDTGEARTQRIPGRTVKSENDL